MTSGKVSRYLKSLKTRLAAEGGKGRMAVGLIMPASAMGVYVCSLSGRSFRSADI